MSTTYGIGRSAGNPVSVDFSINNPSARSIPFGVAIQANGQHAPPTAWNPARSAKLIQSYRELNGDSDPMPRLCGTPFSTDSDVTESGDEQFLANSSSELDESDRNISSRGSSEVSWGDRWSDPANSPREASDVESDNGDDLALRDGFGENEIYEAPSDDEEVDFTPSMSPLDQRIEALAEDFLNRYNFQIETRA